MTVSNEFSQSSGQADRYLILMRHAKSDWGNESVSDHDRTLSPRGQRDTPRMASWLQGLGRVPDLILSSSSERTRETVDLLLSTWNLSVEAHYTQSLYLASPDAILSSVIAHGRQAKTAMVVAHNPGMTYLVSSLAGQSMEMPTAAVAIFQTSQLEVDWAEMNSETRWKLIHFMRPKAL